MLESLVFSADAKLIAAIQNICAKVDLRPNVCSEPEQIASRLVRSKCSGVVVDGTDTQVARDILDLMRKSPSNKRAVSIAVVRNSTANLGAMFELRMPAAADLALRTFRAARAAMLSEYRRYCRHPLQTPVIITTPSGQELHGRCINLSQGGLGVQFTGCHPPAVKTAVRVRLALPPAGILAEAKGEIVWCTTEGRAGLQYQGASPRDRQNLDQWLAKRA